MIPDMRAAALTAVAFGLVGLAGCGGDDTETGTETAQTCTSKSAPNVTDFSVLNMSCDEADALAGEVVGSLSRQPFTAAGFECEIQGGSARTTRPIVGAEDIRCTSGEREFRFSFGD
jgi:hypothetical protein